MKLRRLQSHWHRLGQSDPMWAILTEPGTRGGQWDEARFFQTGEAEIRDRFRDLERRGIRPEPGQALDFGCGIGRLTQALAGRFRHVTGVDIAPSMIERAMALNRHPAACAYLVNDADHLGVFETASFDFIYSNITLQHMEPGYALGYLTEFVRILKPGGILVFQMPDRESDTDSRALVPTLRRWWKSLLGERGFRRADNLWQTLLAGFRPRMEMYGARPEDLSRHLRSAGARMLDVWPNDHAGGRWVSYWYAATREASPAHDPDHPPE